MIELLDHSNLSGITISNITRLSQFPELQQGQLFLLISAFPNLKIFNFYPYKRIYDVNILALHAIKPI